MDLDHKELYSLIASFICNANDETLSEIKNESVVNELIFFSSLHSKEDIKNSIINLIERM